MGLNISVQYQMKKKGYDEGQQDQKDRKETFNDHALQGMENLEPQSMFPHGYISSMIILRFYQPKG